MAEGIRKPCPDCKRPILIDAASCRCGWKSAASKAAHDVDSNGRTKRCACGSVASVYTSDGEPRCSACDSKHRFDEVRDGPGYAAFKAKLDATRKVTPQVEREPGCDDELVRT